MVRGVRKMFRFSFIRLNQSHDFIFVRFLFCFNEHFIISHKTKAHSYQYTSACVCSCLYCVNNMFPGYFCDRK